jgi:hypothetical protein
LDVVRIGGRFVTSLEAICRFLAEQQSDTAATKPVEVEDVNAEDRRQDRLEATVKELCGAAA